MKVSIEVLIIIFLIIIAIIIMTLILFINGRLLNPQHLHHIGFIIVVPGPLRRNLHNPLLHIIDRNRVEV